MAKTKASTKRSTTAKSTKPKKKKATTKKKTPDDEVSINRRRTDRRSKKSEIDAETKPKSKTKTGTKAKVKKPTKTKRKPNSKTEVTASAEVKPETNKATQPPVESSKPERRKVQRRRQIDPTTCERDYSEEEIEFMHALDAYKRSSGRMFPTCSEILEVVRALGYIKTLPVEETAATSDQNGQENPHSADVSSASSESEFSLDNGNESIDENDSSVDLIIAPIDFSSSDSIDVNQLS